MAKGDGLKKRVPFTKNDPRINKNGRPKKLPELHIILEKVLGAESKKDVTEAEAIIKALLIRAKKGDVRASEVLLERAFGKAKQTHEVEGKIELKHTGGIGIASWVKEQLKDADSGK